MTARERRREKRINGGICRCGNKRGRYGDCWKCLRKAVKKAYEEFLATLTKEQIGLFNKYHGAKEKRTSLIILD